MLANYHTHTTFCDGKNTAEEMVTAAIEKGFSAIGFSGHGTTSYDLRYCMTDIPGYIAEIRRLKEKYRGIIQIYLGVEEDSYAPVNRKDFDYVICSSHYICRDGKPYPFDSKYDYFLHCLSLFGNNLPEFAESYYSSFCDHILSRKPDVIGHFDLITKFDECQEDRFLHDENYWRIARKYTLEALKSGSIFEVNTGLISRGYRTSPCPHERLLHTICKNGGRVMLSSDAHKAENLDFGFTETRALLRDIGFDCVWVLFDGQWQKDPL